MKTERRHALETNVVSTWLNAQVERFRPYRTVLLAGTIGACTLLLVAVILRNRSQTRNETSWERYLSASVAVGDDLDALKAVADDFPKTKAGHWAMLTMADRLRIRGADSFFEMQEDLDTARANLKEAKELYESVLEEPKLDDFLAEWASFGLAQTLECQCDLPEAIKAYEKVADGWPNGNYAKLARSRIEALQKPAAEEFADWFRARIREKAKSRLGTNLGGAGLDSGKSLFDRGNEDDGPILPGFDHGLTGKPEESPDKGGKSDSDDSEKGAPLGGEKEGEPDASKDSPADAAPEKESAGETPNP